MAGRNNWNKLVEQMRPDRRARIEQGVRDDLKGMLLSEIRRVAGLTQEQVSESLGIKQPTLSQLEAQNDMQITTLRRIIEALGGELEILANFSGTQIKLGQFNNPLRSPSAQNRTLSYANVDKTEWLIDKMKSGWFSRREILKLAADEFPDVPRKKLEGTIGVYFSDSINPKWPTYKAIQARGLKAVERGGRRHLEIAANGDRSLPSDCKQPSFRRPRPAANHVQSKRTPNGQPSIVRQVWNSNDPSVWEVAYERYWDVKSVRQNLPIEKEMDQLDPENVRAMDAQAWYEFLLTKYFPWKYTDSRWDNASNLRTYKTNNGLSKLHAIKERLFSLDRNDIRECLKEADKIKGLGIPGASGLLAVLFPSHFGTVDQFVVKALREIPELPERDRIARVRPENLTFKDGVLLIQIMRRKAAELNALFGTTTWTPRKIDMVLWSCGR